MAAVVSEHAAALAAQIERDRDLLTTRWLERVRERHGASRSSSRPELLDSLPEYLTHLSAALRRGGALAEGADDATRPIVGVAGEHGGQRYRHGFDVRAVVVEYGILLDVLFERFIEVGLHLDVYEARLLVRELSLGIAAAVEQFSAEREADIRASHEALKQAQAYEQQLLGIVSHELRNPLAIILACADLAGRCKTLSAAAGRALQRLRANAERAVRLIGDLLDFTQARVLGQMPVRPEPVDMQELVRAAVEEAALTHPDRRVEQRGETGPLPGRWDRDRVAQALANLLDNALKFSPPGSTVTVEARAEDGQVCVAVHNGGPAIAPERLAAVFEPFEREGPAVSARQSLGLGLHISRQIARAHRGDLTARSAAGAGTTFTLTLPRGEPSPGDPIAAR